MPTSPTATTPYIIPLMIGAGMDVAPYWKEACHALGRADPVLGNLIRAADGAVLRRRNDAFFSLSRSIVAQQISIHAADAVWQRLLSHVGAMTPKTVVSPKRRCPEWLRTIAIQSTLYPWFSGALY